MENEYREERTESEMILRRPILVKEDKVRMMMEEAKKIVCRPNVFA